MSWTSGTAYGFSSGPEAHWHERAACRDADPEIFFFDGLSVLDLQMQATAKRFCVRCPVRIECGGVGAGQAWGVWGGRTSRERRGMPEPTLRSCARCRDPFALDPDHPHAKLCHGCDQRRKPEAVKPGAVSHA